MKKMFSAAVAMAVLCAASSAFAEGGKWKFVFGPGGGSGEKVEAVSPTAQIGSDGKFGFEPKSNVTVSGKAVTSERPFLFSVKTGEGNYKVTVTVGGADVDSNTTIKSECRQLQYDNLKTAKGETKTVTYYANVRLPKIEGSDRSVGLKKAPARNYDEAENPRWDDKLTFEFNGTHPSVQSIEIEAVTDIPVVYIVGDSTVCDQQGEPYNSWGQMFPRFVKDVAVANHAESGEAYSSFVGERRWDKIKSTLKKGDFVLMQMGHNDQKNKDPNWAATGYKDLMRKLCSEAKAVGAIPVLITPMNRHSFKEGKITNSLAGFPDAVREVAAEIKVPLVDLNAMSKPLYEFYGTEESLKIFAPKDGTHHNNIGSYELAKCVAEGVKEKVPELAKFLRDDFKGFDPAKPDSIAEFSIPASPSIQLSRPAGS